MPLRLTLRLVVAGLATLVTALLVITLLPTRPASSPRASAIAGAQAWAMVEHLFHVDMPAAGMPFPRVTLPAPATPPSITGGPAVAQAPVAARPAPARSRAVAIDRHAQPPAPVTAAVPLPAPVDVAPPVADNPVPAPAPAPSLLDAVTSLVANLLGLLTGG